MLNCVDVPVAVPVERWDLESVSASSETLQSNMLRFGAFMNEASSFDSLAFRMAHGEAVGLDPQSRMLLEGVYNAMQVSQAELPNHPFLCFEKNILAFQHCFLKLYQKMCPLRGAHYC